jgi:hypothetical protein
MTCSGLNQVSAAGILERFRALRASIALLPCWVYGDPVPGRILASAQLVPGPHGLMTFSAWFE